ncbi:hypothetical protein CHARACLAT_033696, partial [Characodon lateralis]|nr:hypothetical protein [Characodon lateralis]
HSRTLSTLLLSTAPTSEDLDPLIILAHSYSILISLTDKQHLGLSTSHPLVDLSINPLVSRFLFPCSRHFTVNKHVTAKLCLLNCFSACGSDP